MGQFKLSATLSGHADDVKALVSPYNDTIISVSRDSNVFVWSNSSGAWKFKVNYTGNKFLNSLAFDPASNSVVFGGQDSLINITNLDTVVAEPDFCLVGHESNVCSLDYKDGQILSGSWDSTARVWENQQEKYVLKGHNSSVWDVKIVSKDRFLTASADKTIKLWEKDRVIKTFVGHEDVVRSIALLPDGSGFVSSSNDTTLRIYKFTGEFVNALMGHESFVYSVRILNNGDIVSCGEDRSVRIWRNNEIVQVIIIPCVSIWTVSVLPNDDIVTGGSDNMIRIFTKDPLRYASESELQAFAEQVQSTAISSQQISQLKTVDASALAIPGTKEGENKFVKSELGVTEVYNWTSNEWVKVGEVVDGPSSDNKVDYDGQKWDYVFDVDIEDGQPPLKLPYNLTDNPYVVAENFLTKNNLPSTYLDDVVKFILKNTGGVNIGQTTENPYADTHRPKILPQMNYLTFLINNSETIVKGIQKINDNENRITNEEFNQIKEHAKNKKHGELSEFASKIITEWTNKLPGFDILRLVITELELPPSEFSRILEIGLDKSNPATYFMTFRLLSNVFANVRWGEAFVSNEETFNQIIDSIGTYDGVQQKALNNVCNAVATVILNFTIYSYKYKSVELSHKLHEKLASIGLYLSKVNSEAAYRLAVGWGNLILLNSKFKDLSYEYFKRSVKSQYSETRFKDLFEEIE